MDTPVIDVRPEPTTDARAIPTSVVRAEDLSARAFLSLLRREPSAIQQAQIVPMRLGDREAFGKVRVTYTTPRLRAILAMKSRKR